MKAFSDGNISLLVFAASCVESTDLAPVSFSKIVKDLLVQLLLEVHTGHSHDGVPKVVVVGLLEVAHHAVG